MYTVVDSNMPHPDSSSILHEPTVYNVKDIMRIFNLGQRQAYELMHKKGFPSFNIGRKLYVEHGALEKWIARQK